MAEEGENRIIMVRCTNAIERELKYKILWVYLNRIELGQSLFGYLITGLVGLLIAYPFLGFFPVAFVLGGIPGIPAGMQFLYLWGMNRPDSYQWDSYHKWGLIGNGERCLRRVSEETVLIPDAKPCHSPFTGTRFEGLSRTDEEQDLVNLPNWCDYRQDGVALARMLTQERVLGTILIPEWEVGEGPAPEYWKQCDPVLPGQTREHFVCPRIGMRLVNKKVNWSEI
jgi:hypothetical protein